MRMRTIAVIAFVFCAVGTATLVYQTAHWHCWQPGGGEIKGGRFYPFMNCDSRFPW